MLTFWNGKICNLDKVQINPYDIGFLRGYGVFDVMCTQNGKPFLLDAHWKRFQNSAKELKLQIPVTKEEYEKIIQKLLASNGFKKSNIRTVLSGGISCDAFSCDGKETFLILVEKFKPLPVEVYEKGAGVITVEHNRHIPRAKITNYVEAIRNQDAKKKKKALEIIFTKNGEALEASTSNFFVVKNNVLATTRDGVLLGTTRNLVVDLARKNKFKVEERKISEKELREADEVFLTATNKDVVPIVKIDGKKIGNGKIGKNTKILMEIFQGFVKNY